ncbi:MAG: DUF192 domain-containing protein [Hydrotalea sp.]|nr:DUF192 domain-containing protein [Hydrotalea sp.]
MIKNILTLCVMASVLVAPAVWPRHGVAQDITPLDKIKITFNDKNTKAAKVTLLVEYATRDATRDQGLMFRTSLPDHGGMLFLFDKPQVVYFWMKNTILPLDMVFIDAAGRVRHIARHATPYSEDSISSQYPVKWVLEVMAGQARQYGIGLGDQMVIVQ